ncbi:FimV/HubP family polar landmark protein [Reinekea marinisedimentorum]|uniref:Pilus assembly protein FimV n=1 Tax=Reinekea marinisedimentorum TaxID=230495 RepID=A0A4V2UJU3_9GAMM|nr:FimV/HubP family polar landmark protein [Reinekea marinisedimentorum]TCS41441.1 pilus assembly protein FimV [Reinekea marinisedimentorum]
MVKKQTLVTLVAFMSLISSAFGLGLGEIKVNSNLNDPLAAEIQLIQLQGLSSTEILPTLASNDDFKRAGIERTFFLANIQFLVQEDKSGNLTIALSTKQAVREPFLNFLVEVNWPGGRLLKEYTILLDPPVFDTGLAVDALVVEPTQSIAAETDLVTTTVVDQKPVQESTVVSQPVTRRDDTLPAGQYRVQRNDTLWEIALKVPDGSGYSPQQVMLAIQDLNPEAFLNNNINRVKAGSVLNLPNESQIAVRSLQEAVGEVQAQNSGSAPKLRNQQGEVQLSATESTASALPGGDAEKDPNGYLELSADSESETTSASGDVSADVDRLQNQLAAAEELNDQYVREREELQTRVSELQEQIAIMERLIDVQNSDLAEVQQAFSQDEQAESVEPAQAEMAVDAAEQAATEEVAAADVNEQMAGTEEAVADVAGEMTETDATATGAEAAMAEMSETAEEASVEPVVEQPVPQPQPAPVADKPAGVMGYVQKFSDWVTASVTNMAILGGGFLLLILLALYARGKKSAKEEEVASTAEELVSDDFSLETEEDFEQDLLAEADEDFEEEISEEPETLDAVVEAEMYMAYQKYDQAEEKLKEAFAEYPDRADIGLKLLEVYAETGDANAFNDLESRLSLSVDEQQEVAGLRKKLPAGSLDELGSGLDSDMMAGDLNLDLDADGLDEEVSLDTTIPDELDFSSELEEDEGAEENSDLDFTLDLDSFGTLDDEADTENLVDLGAESEKKPEVEELSTDLDFDLDLDDLDDSALTFDEPEANTEEEISLDDELDLSEIASFDEPSPELNSASEEPEAGEASIDLDLEEDASGLAFSLDEEPAELSEDLGFSLDLDEETDELTAADELVEIEPELPVVSDVEGSLIDNEITLDIEEPELEDVADSELAESGTSLVEEGLSLAKEERSSSLEEDDTDFASLDFSDEALDLDLDLSDEMTADPLALSDEEVDLGLDSEVSEFDAEADEDPLQQLADSLDSGAELDDDDFDFLSGSDEASTKLDLARAYIEMDDKEGARDILEEVLDEGTDEQKAQANALIEQL